MHIASRYSYYYNGSSYSAEAEQVFSVMSGLTSEEKALMAEAIDDWVAGGHWTLIGEIQIYGLWTEANALKGWKGVFNASKQGSASFVTKQGFDITSLNFIRTNFLATAPGFSQNDGFVGTYIVSNADTATSGRRLVNSFGTSDVELNQEPGSLRLRFAMNSNTQSIYSGESFFSNESYYEAVRSISTHQAIWKDGLQLQSTAVVSVGEFQNVVDITFDGRVGAAVIGAAVGFNRATFFPILQTLLLGLRALSLITFTIDTTLFTIDSSLFTIDTTTLTI
jgi:hypothetical protein